MQEFNKAELLLYKLKYKLKTIIIHQTVTYQKVIVVPDSEEHIEKIITRLTPKECKVMTNTSQILSVH